MKNYIKSNPIILLVIVLIGLVCYFAYSNNSKAAKIKVLSLEKDKYKNEIDSTLARYNQFKIKSDKIIDSLELDRNSNIELLESLRSERDSILKSDPKITDKIREDILKDLENESNN